jgi:hypothetical protein
MRRALALSRYLALKEGVNDVADSMGHRDACRFRMLLKGGVLIFPQIQNHFDLVAFGFHCSTLLKL